MAKQLDMGDTTIGYSTKGIDALISVIETSIDADAKKIDPKTSTAYKTLLETLRMYWDGVDEANFEKDLETAATTLAARLRDYKSRVATALRKYRSNFGKFQETTYIKGSVKI